MSFITLSCVYLTLCLVDVNIKQLPEPYKIKVT